ncbi:MAG: hypothetical protein HQM01_00905 [Magnetococcales bacterium]|nr:hypothetical protein [Magnetococcales bacterium]
MASPNLHESNKSMRAAQIASPFGGPWLARIGCLACAKQPLTDLERIKYSLKGDGRPYPIAWTTTSHGIRPPGTPGPGLVNRAPGSRNRPMEFPAAQTLEDFQALLPWRVERAMLPKIKVAA